MPIYFLPPNKFVLWQEKRDLNTESLETNDVLFTETNERVMYVDM